MTPSQSDRRRPSRDASRSAAQPTPSIRYQIVSQIASQDSGLLYRGIRSDDGSSIDILVVSNLSGSERERIDRRITLAREVDHPSVARVIAAQGSSQDVTYILEPVPTVTLAGFLAEPKAVEATQLISFGLQIASAIASGHRLGLVHGRLSPLSIHVREDGSPQVDYVRPPDLQVTHSADLDETRFQAPESQGAKQCDAAADVFSLAMLLQWLFLGECAGATDLARMLRERLSKSISDSQLEVSELDALAQLLNEAQAEDPAARVDADQLVASLERLAASCFPTGERLSDAKLGITRSLGDTDSELDVTREFELRLDPSHSPAMHPTSQPPKQIGRFRLLEKLGEGGMGAVFKAEDLADGSTVALKLLSSRVVANPAAVRRFRKEARMLSEIRSPFVTNLVEVNQDNGIHYIVMEFVAGMNLRQALRTWGLPKGCLLYTSDAADDLVSV